MYINYDEYNNPLSNTDVGGAAGLTLSEGESTITLENENVRVIFHTENGVIKEFVNKETKQYLTKDAVADTPFTVQYEDGLENSGKFLWSVSEDTEEQKKLEFRWILKTGATVVTHARLAKHSDTVAFDVAVEGNKLDHYIKSVEYPVITGIKALCEGGKDQFVSPSATGYLFSNPAESFNQDDFHGIFKEMGMYPSGWFFTMQFMAYITENVGGFYLGTTDGGSGIKSFSFVGTGDGTLRAGIHHFLDDIAEENVVFDYDVEISNLTKGYWQEAGDRYYAFAKNQKWTSKGKLEDRDDINKILFEDTVLCNWSVFSLRKLEEGAIENIYKMYPFYKERISGKILYVYSPKWCRITPCAEWDAYFPAKIDPTFMELVREGGDQMILFGNNTIFLASYEYDKEKYPIEDWCIKQADGQPSSIFFGSTLYYACPSFEAWRDFTVAVNEEQYKTYGMNGVYHDVDTAAICPMQCFDRSHPHGTRVNIISDFLETERRYKEVANQYGQYSVGQEMIYEQLLPYNDYYQARANADVYGTMEVEQFYPLLNRGQAVKIPLFEYVYHAYGALRTDGFLLPTEETGDVYFYAQAFTMLNGGLPQHNFDFAGLAKYYDTELIRQECIEFLEGLGQARTGYGKEFLVYGDMRKAPTVDKGTVTYSYHRDLSYSGGINPTDGEVTVDRVVSSAYEHGGKIGIFLCNITEEDMDVNFVIEAERIYDIENAKVMIYDKEQDKLVDFAEISGGTAECSLTLPSRETVMLVIRK